ncbi:MAG: ATP-binding protein [Planctomycetes bacterium]|nr:ATP-binding protein [Planctomycetota bacterium]
MLRGPRRVGKTVSLKLLVAQLIEERGWDGRTISYLTFDTVRTLAQAEEILREAVHGRALRLLIVDEVTALSGWQRVIKKLRDDGTLARPCVLLTGSSSHDLKAGSERLAGRRGAVPLPDQILLPMPYPAFLEQIGRAGIAVEPREAIRAYLEAGGFPFRVERYVESMRGTGRYEPAEDLQVFDDVIFYELTRRRLDRSIALEVLGRLSSISTSAVSYEGFAKAITASRDTARKYLDVLGDAFLLATISSYDTGRGRVAPKKNRKFLWIDPALGYLAPWLRQGEAARAEWLVGAALLRQFEARLWEGLSSPRNVFTWKSKAGNEVDYLVVDRSRRLLFPVEVKHQRAIADWDFQVMERAFGKGLLVTPEVDRERPRSRAVTLERFLRETDKLVG